MSYKVVCLPFPVYFVFPFSAHAAIFCSLRGVCDKLMNNKWGFMFVDCEMILTWLLLLIFAFEWCIELQVIPEGYYLGLSIENVSFFCFPSY